MVVGKPFQNAVVINLNQSNDLFKFVFQATVRTDLNDDPRLSRFLIIQNYIRYGKARPFVQGRSRSGTSCMVFAW